MDNHWNVTTSSGRRVSLLCEDSPDYAASYASSQMSPTPPLSPDYRCPYAPMRSDSIGSAGSTASSFQSLYSPATPPNVSLPPLDKMVPLPPSTFFPPLPADSRPAAADAATLTTTTVSTSPVLDPALMHHDGCASPVSSAHLSRQSSPAASPKTAAASPVVKRSARRYTCRCGKSFTTSGHLARHTRIHTGEKNYVCPESGCGARFSRQDNCMQHYRTHQTGSSNKRSARKRRLDVAEPPAVVVPVPVVPAVPAAAAPLASEPPPPVPESPYHHHHHHHHHGGGGGGSGLLPPATHAAVYDPQLLVPASCMTGSYPDMFPAVGLDALAKVACSGF